MTPMIDGLMAVAQAQQAPDQGAQCAQMSLFLLVIIAIFYFIIIRPQRKQQVEQQRFLDRLKEGDRVITSSGIFGRIIKLEADVVTLDVGDRTRIRFLRNQVSRYQPGVEAEPTEDSPSSSPRDARRKRK